MIKLAKQAMGKASNEMIKEAGKQAGKYAARVVVLGGAAIGVNYLTHKTKEKGIELTKKFEKAVKDGAQSTADVIQGNKKSEPVKTGVKIVKGAVKTVGTAALVGAGTIVTAKVAGYVRDSGKNIAEELTADYRKVKYFGEEEAIEIYEDDIEYL